MPAEIGGEGYDDIVRAPHLAASRREFNGNAHNYPHNTGRFIEAAGWRAAGDMRVTAGTDRRTTCNSRCR